MISEEEYKAMQAKALEQFRNGESLYGKGGAFAPLIKQFIETALDAEMESHLDEEERAAKNKRNGRGRKTLKTSDGEIEITTPQDRHSTFDPRIIKKRETIMAQTLESKILGLYGLGMSFRDISRHIEEMYNMEISHATLSEITEKIVPEIRQWQSRSLEPVYSIVWMDAIHYKVKDEGKVISKALYNILGVNPEGRKELLGMYVSESEGANFWLGVLTDLNNRGLEDILIACIDNLKGFPEAIEAIYPKCDVQTCVIHQIRNSIRYVVSKEQKEFMKDLKLVYQADTKSQAEDNLDALEAKWGKRYPIVIKSWRNNWSNLSKYFDYTKAIRKLIYTTNAVEGYHRQLRKVTKTKGAFTSDMALLKLVYLASRHITKKWNAPLQNWADVAQQLAIRFGDRMKINLAL